MNKVAWNLLKYETTKFEIKIAYIIVLWIPPKVDLSDVLLLFILSNEALLDKSTTLSRFSLLFDTKLCGGSNSLTSNFST